MVRVAMVFDTGNITGNRLLIAGNVAGNHLLIAGDIAGDQLPAIGVHFCFGPCRYNC